MTLKMIFKKNIDNEMKKGPGVPDHIRHFNSLMMGLCTLS